jgi:hypothetical protein
MVNGIIQSAQQIVKTDVNVIYLRRLSTHEHKYANVL